MWHVFKRFGGEVVGVNSLVQEILADILLARDISCFGWEVRQRLMV